MTRQRITFEVDVGAARRALTEPVLINDFGYIPGTLVVENIPEPPVVDRFELVITSDPADGGILDDYLKYEVLSAVYPRIGQRTAQFFRVTKAGS